MMPGVDGVAGGADAVAVAAAVVDVQLRWNVGALQFDEQRCSLNTSISVIGRYLRERRAGTWA